MVTGSIHGRLGKKGVALLRPDWEGFLQRFHVGRVCVSDTVVMISVPLGQWRDYDFHQGMIEIIPGGVGRILRLGLVGPDYDYGIMVVSSGRHDHRHDGSQKVISLRDVSGI